MQRLEHVAEHAKVVSKRHTWFLLYRCSDICLLTATTHTLPTHTLYLERHNAFVVSTNVYVAKY